MSASFRRDGAHKECARVGILKLQTGNEVSYFFSEADNTEKVEQTSDCRVATRQWGEKESGSFNVKLKTIGSSEAH